MSDATIAVRIIDALEAAANNAIGGKTALVSVNIEMLGYSAKGEVEVSVARKTRTLAFLRADFRDGTGVRIAIANSIHKVLAQKTS